jgi:polyisoprenoid-binding protein YceI
MRKSFFLLLVFFLSNNIFAEKCEYSYDPSNTKLEWTAYKFIEKAGVKGSFNSINVTGVKSANSIEEAVKDMQFEIKSDSVNSGNVDRDKKLVASFFGTMKNSTSIKGSIKNVQPGKGEARLILKLNDVEKTIPLTYTIKDKTDVELKVALDIAAQFGAEKSLAELNKVCSELHKKNKDEASKLWPNVDVVITTKFKANCK